MKRKQSSSIIGSSFINQCIRDIPSGLIYKEFRILGNKFDAILVPSSQKKVIEWKEIKKEINLNGLNIYVLEFTKNGKFKNIKENFGELLKIPLLKKHYPDVQLKGFYSIHERISKKYQKIVNKELNSIFRCNFPIKVIERRQLRKEFNLITSGWKSGKKNKPE